MTRVVSLCLALVFTAAVALPGASAKNPTPEPTPTGSAEHTKNKRKSTWNKHTRRRPGQRGPKSKIPPNPNKRRGFIRPKALGGLVAAEGAAYLVELSYEYNQLATGPISDPDFTFLDDDEADLVGIDLTSSGYWGGVWDYWTDW